MEYCVASKNSNEYPASKWEIFYVAKVEKTETDIECILWLQLY